AARAARGTHRLRQRARLLPDVRRGGGDYRRLSSGADAAPPAGGRVAVSVAHVVPDVGGAQRPRHRRLGGLGRRAGARAAARLARRRPRPDVDRHRRRRAGLHRPAAARGAAMSVPGDVATLAAYAMLILVGFLPNELWRMLGIVLARGLDEDSQV